MTPNFIIKTGLFICHLKKHRTAAVNRQAVKQAIIPHLTLQNFPDGGQRNAGSNTLNLAKGMFAAILCV
jgi:hypothetical protein